MDDRTQDETDDEFNWITGRNGLCELARKHGGRYGLACLMVLIAVWIQEGYFDF